LALAMPQGGPGGTRAAASNATTAACAGRYTSCGGYGSSSPCCANLTCKKYSSYSPIGICEPAPGAVSSAPGGGSPAPGGGSPAAGGGSHGGGKCAQRNRPCGPNCCANLTCSRSSPLERGTCVPKGSCAGLNKSCGTYGPGAGASAGSLPCCANLTCSKSSPYMPGACLPPAPAGQVPAADRSAGKAPTSWGPEGQALASGTPSRLVVQAPPGAGLALAAAAVAVFAALALGRRSSRGRTGMEEPLVPP